jgi:uncharacterized peroxidase-related enzyme
MSRISLPASITDAPHASQPFLEGVNNLLGSVPNFFRMTANSPVAIEGFLGLNGALAKGELDPQTRERIALAVAQINGCDYCLSAHTYLGKNIAKLDDAEIAANRKGTSTDAKAAAAVAFAAALVQKRGQVSHDDINAVKAAGYSDAALVEITAHVAVNTLSNYINEAFGTPVDFPVVSAAAA